MHCRLIAPSIAAFTLVLCAPAAQADWSGQGEAGFVMARGNADTDTGNLKLSVAMKGRHWNHAANAGALYGMNNQITSSDRWDVRWQSDYRLDGKPFVFGAARYEQDRFNGFQFQATLTLGAGYQFVDTDRVKLSTSLGAGYRRLLPQQLVRDPLGNVIDRIEGEETSDTVANASLNYQHQITSNTTIINKLVVESGQDNTFAQNDFSLQVAMTQKIALGLGYGVRHNTKPPLTLGKTDQLTTANLVYRFK